MSKPIVVHMNDVETFQPPYHKDVISREPINPQKGGKHLRCRITEGQPGGGDHLFIPPGVPHQFIKEIWPFVIALVLALVLVTYIPSIAMWLPSLLMPAK
jgi:hypothetical protein